GRGTGLGRGRARGGRPFPGAGASQRAARGAAWAPAATGDDPGTSSGGRPCSPVRGRAPSAWSSRGGGHPGAGGGDVILRRDGEKALELLAGAAAGSLAAAGQLAALLGRLPPGPAAAALAGAPAPQQDADPSHVDLLQEI